MRVGAIDPGSHATVCVHCPEASVASGLRWHFLDVPVAVSGNSERVDARALAAFLQRHAPDRVFVEHVGPMPRQGLGSTAVFMRAAGYCEAVPLALGFPVMLITPQRWKKHHGIKKAGEDENAKEVSRQLALSLIPEIAAHLTRKKDHGRAESALIALYGAACMAPIAG